MLEKSHVALFQKSEVGAGSPTASSYNSYGMDVGTIQRGTHAPLYLGALFRVCLCASRFSPLCKINLCRENK